MIFDLHVVITDLHTGIYIYSLALPSDDICYPAISSKILSNIDSWAATNSLY